ncbi:hypothetical protein NUW54_g11122 [Trametes sanguinea]|uniref:Uncharacterized protein n=1 Tax=Trametes sanguinea TaxID=158606 RepID=A0ACC1NKI4_9APHY|nr:hypothetical protein NUW54_g11122 [Trametes sanguinea]
MGDPRRESQVGASIMYVLVFPGANIREPLTERVMHAMRCRPSLLGLLGHASSSRFCCNVLCDRDHLVLGREGRLPRAQVQPRASQPLGDGRGWYQNVLQMRYKSEWKPTLLLRHTRLSITSMSTGYAPAAYRGKKYRFTMPDGYTYVGMFDNAVDTSSGVRWRFTFASPDSHTALIDPAKCVATDAAVSAYGPDIDDSPANRIGTNRRPLPPRGTFPF